MVNSSSGLTSEENAKLKQILGDTASVLVHAVARILFSPENSGEWQNTRKCGALALLIDREKEGVKILRMFDLKSWEILFEEELYVGMKYESAAPYFHTFEVDGGIVGFDFPDDRQADVFWSKVQQMIPKESNSQQSYGASFVQEEGLFGAVKSFLGIESSNAASSTSQVSRPKNIKHLQHIGYDPSEGFKVENIPEEWKSMFKAAGIKPKDVQNPETAQAIVQTMERFSSAKEPSENFSAGGGAPAAAPPARRFGAPPPPMRSRVPSAPTTSRGIPPPQPRSQAPPARIFPASSNSISAAAPVPAAPLAPPVCAPPVPSPSPASDAPKASGNRVNLLADIRKGRALNKISPPSGSTNASREKEAIPDLKKMNVADQNDLANQLRMLMAARRKVTAEKSHVEEEDDDWE